MSARNDGPTSLVAGLLRCESAIPTNAPSAAGLLVPELEQSLEAPSRLRQSGWAGGKGRRRRTTRILSIAPFLVVVSAIKR